ncbi:MAG: Uma2 family endonuclease [Methylovulum sp.]|uniref:Uma2 family endonuclease n=1 Tax=Methylovulum sp. TaxID=1916980 RepID=UPI00262BE9A7|nr:Uma2 family endonuclease [Methylovulum sp.]MDD2723252.1 Uma2 family endonuclease [Methylovulum sp.]MDD5123427.1 Uma2 family endonuclease [Methylovulum sp.]
MSAVLKPSEFISVEDYLREELARQIKHELIDGHVYAMAGVSANHERIAGNVYRKFGDHLENSPCEPFGSDMKLRVKDNFFYPDVMVDCQFDESEPYYTETPVLIVEVLSRSTRKKDETLKFMTYINLPSVQEYVLIEQDIADVTVLRRREGWLPNHYFLGDDITFESINLTLPVADIYRRVQNQDVAAFLSGEAGQPL